MTPLYIEVLGVKKLWCSGRSRTKYQGPGYPWALHSSIPALVARTLKIMLKPANRPPDCWFETQLHDLHDLHYECDPCGAVCRECILWVYLHKEREEDFEDSATSSTKRWKRQKKEPADPGGAVTLAYHGNGEAAEFDSTGIEPSGIKNDDKNSTTQVFVEDDVLIGD
ncbi:hypothetical protein QVD17_15835 [Tagetes erecta]|uniref:Uncharacterized protein n=1 Tax=Tagetes erecta TaxID=13708 RepID=A0AAD8KVN2_TARER|nr:hypothetical protein QVD17_15835 [Tagetes erecta]